MSEALEEDDVPIAQYHEVANSSNVPERTEVQEDFSCLRNRPAQPQEAHLLPGINHDGSREIFQFDRSNPDSDLLGKGELKLRMTSFYDWPRPLQPIANCLAQNGLFYTGSRDKVSCCYCMTQMRASELWEDSDIRNRVCLPDCPYIANRKAV